MYTNLYMNFDKDYLLLRWNREDKPVQKLDGIPPTPQCLRKRTDSSSHMCETLIY